MAYAQEAPVPLICSFTGTIDSIATAKKHEADFLVVKGKTKSRPLLSLDISVKLGVLHLINTTQTTESTEKQVPQCEDKIKQLVEEYHNIFEGLGKHKTIKAKLIVDDTVQPFAHKRRRVPYNLQKKATIEEERLQQLGIIEEVPDDQPTTWCTNAVIIPKPHNPENISYCSDMRVPNTAIKTTRHGTNHSRGRQILSKWCYCIFRSRHE